MARLYDNYKGILRVLYKIEIFLSTFIMTTIILINAANIFSRILFSRSIGWTTELSLILFVYTVMFSIPALYYDNEMITMSFLEDKLIGKKRIILKLIIELFILFFLLIFIYHAAYLSWSQRVLLSRGLQISRSFVTFPASIAGLLLLLNNIDKLIEIFKELFSSSSIENEETPPKEHV